MRRFCRTTRCLLGVLLVMTACRPASAQGTITRLSDMVLDSKALLFASNATYGRAINGEAFQAEALLTVGGYQYATWYHLGSADEDIYLARRAVSGTTWEVMDTGANMTRTTSDAHNVISMGVASDGTVHLSYDHHGHTLRYLESIPGAATATTWNTSLLTPERSSLNAGGTAVTVVTYPQFVSDPSTSDMLMNYRIGSSGNGDVMMATYDTATGRWNTPHQIINGTGGAVYTDALGSSSTRNAYLNGFDVDATGRIHVTWTWRESAGGTNHDIDYAYSDDGGTTWRNNSGTVVGTTNAPMRYDSPGLIIDDGNAANGLLGQIDRRNTLMNQCTQAVDLDGRVHAIMWHADDAHANAVSGFTTAPAAYFHYFRNPTTGSWTRRELPTTRAVGSRPDVAYDADGNLYAAYVTPGAGDAGGYYTSGDLVIATASKATGYADWQIVSTDTRDFAGEPRIDQQRLLSAGVVSVFLQENNAAVTSITGTPLHVIEYAKQANLVIWAGDHGGTWRSGSGLDWDDDGDDVGSSSFDDGERVVFDNNATSFNVQVVGTVAPSSIRFDNTSSRPYTFSGTGIGGSANLHVAGGGKVTLANAANTYSGSTIITNGTLALAAGGSIASPSITIETAGMLDVSGLAGGLVLASGQTLDHAGSQAMTGAVAVGSGGTLIGRGSFAGAVTAHAGGTFRIGNDGITLRPQGVAIDTFESYAVGDVRSVASPPWTAHLSTTLNDIVAAGTGNKALTVGGNVSGYVGTSRTLAANASIANTDTATLFFRFNARTSTLDQSFGLADMATTTNTLFTDFEAQVRLTGDTATTVRVDARDAAAFTAPLATGLALNAWYNVWMVVNQVTDTYDIYLNTGTNDAVSANKLNASPLRFRNGTASSLTTILGLAGQSPIDNPVWYDDLYRLTGASLSNPLRGSAGLLLGDSVSVTVGGDFHLDAGGTLAIDVATADIFDRLVVNGQATLNGTLAVAAPAGMLPPLGSTFDVISASGMVGLPTIDDRSYLGVEAAVIGGSTLRLTTTARGPSVRTVSTGLTVADDTPFADTLVLVKRGAGTLVRGGSNPLAAGAVVEGGRLEVTSTDALGSGPLTIRAGATAALLADALALSALHLDDGSSLDIGLCRLDIATGGITEAALRSLLINGHEDPVSLPGIISHDAQLASLTIGYVITPDGSATVRIAAPGDTNLDGLVDMVDVVDFINTGLYDMPQASSWQSGDFNYDGITDALDVVEMLSHGLYDQGGYLPITGTVAVVPEPGAGALMAMGIALTAAARCLAAGGSRPPLHHHHACAIGRPLLPVRAALRCARITGSPAAAPIVTARASTLGARA